MATILAINGPNLNLLGQREPHIYGSDSLDSINDRLAQLCQQAGHQFAHFQSNSEGELINRLHQARAEDADFIIINPGGLTHSSVALRDGILAAEIPFIEVHLSNPYAREEFRHKSFFTDIAAGSIVGLGTLGYELALQAALQRV